MDEEQFKTAAVKFMAATISFFLGMVIAQMLGL